MVPARRHHLPSPAEPWDQAAEPLRQRLEGVHGQQERPLERRLRHVLRDAGRGKLGLAKREWKRRDQVLHQRPTRDSRQPGRPRDHQRDHLEREHRDCSSRGDYFGRQSSAAAAATLWCHRAASGLERRLQRQWNPYHRQCLRVSAFARGLLLRQDRRYPLLHSASRRGHGDGCRGGPRGRAPRRCCGNLTHRSGQESHLSGGHFRAYRLQSLPGRRLSRQGNVPGVDDLDRLRNRGLARLQVRDRRHAARYCQRGQCRVD